MTVFTVMPAGLPAACWRSVAMAMPKPLQFSPPLSSPDTSSLGPSSFLCRSLSLPILGPQSEQRISWSNHGFPSEFQVSMHPRTHMFPKASESVGFLPGAKCRSRIACSVKDREHGEVSIQNNENVDYAGDGRVEGEEEKVVQFDVSSNCVNPSFRVSPFLQRSVDATSYKKVRILFVSEGNVCRSVFAEAIFKALLQEHGLENLVECTSKAAKDYNEGEAPDGRAVQVAQELGLQLEDGAVARVFDCASDMVSSDLILVMDKFNASDVLKEVTVYEAIDKEGRYSYKVRRLGEFCRSRKIEDIDDPLYGNMGGPEELELLREVYGDLRESCEGVIQFLLDTKSSLQGPETLKQGIGHSLGQMESLDWLVPPMLQRT